MSNVQLMYSQPNLYYMYLLVYLCVQLQERHEVFHHGRIKLLSLNQFKHLNMSLPVTVEIFIKLKHIISSFTYPRRNI